VWASDAHHLLAWVLSTETARVHYRPAVLYTDDAGARLLVDGAGLAFDEVHTTLNALSASDPSWWALGKLYAYREQAVPFVHIDSDVFLWRRLRPDVESAPVFAQHPDVISPGRSFYHPEVLEAALAGAGDGWLPAQWRWYRASGLAPRAESCGIVGGHRVDFLRHYADQAIHLVEHRGNQEAWNGLDDRAAHVVLIEQYLLAACVEHHRHHRDSGDDDFGIAYVFASSHDAFTPARAAAAGYTHLIAGSKGDPDIAARLEARVAADYPEAYRRCLQLAASLDPRLPGVA
jgi:hypothetical protein